MNFVNARILALCCLFFAEALGAQTPPPAPTSASGVDLNAVDKSADPCQDFYQYACGAWMKNNPIPPDESRWSRFNELHERNLAILRDILQEAEKNQSASPIDQKIGGFYASCMNEEHIEQLGVKPLQAELERIAKVSDGPQLLAEIARLQQRQIPVFFEFGPNPDLRNAKMMIAGVDQGGLGLPEKEYYTRTDPKSVELRQKYVAAIVKIFTLAGVSQADAERKATTVLSIESDLAAASLDVTSRRDPQKLFHQMSPSDLAALSPNFNFNQFFTEVNAPKFSVVNVAVPDFVKAFSKLVTTRPMADLRDYLAWHYLSASAPLLTKPFVEADFDFYQRALLGTKEMKPRWKRCVAATDDELGEALGQRYVEKTFGKEGKERTLAMVHEIEHEMGVDLQSLAWMSPETKQQALVKLRAVTNKIGYPDKWRDYSSVNIVPGDYFGNWYRANEFEYKRQLDKVGQPVDRSEWGMTPPTVNAYYNPTENNINFPAGILQPPFYSNKAGDALNYGGIGAVVGHELTHAFDDEGRQFDADGNLKDWWQKSDEDRFNKLAECTVNEYGSFSPAPGVELNGKLTLGENTADNGGIRLAYMALMDDLAKKSIPPSKETDGYTEAQQFFLGFGQVWCENTRPETARFLAQTNPHSPGKFRTNGVVKNVPEFDKAFGCKATNKMYVVQGSGCRVW